MAILSSKPRNRKRNTSKSKASARTSTSWIHGSGKKKKGGKTASKLKSVNDHYHKLNAEIGVLENFLAGHQRSAANQERMRRENIIPPPEAQGGKHKARRRMSAAERRQYLAERELGGIKFFALFCLACAIGWWLLKSGL